MEQAPPDAGEAFVPYDPKDLQPVVLLLDASSAMEDVGVARLREGVLRMQREVAADGYGAKRLDLAVATFGARVETVRPFSSVVRLKPLPMATGGGRSIGAAVRRAFQLLKSRRADYLAAGVTHFAPTIYLVATGEPTDRWETAARLIDDGVYRTRVLAIGLNGADLRPLGDFARRPPLSLRGFAVEELFRWLANDLVGLCRPRPDGLVGPAPRLHEDGWIDRPEGYLTSDGWISG